jgi:hypothetical protein
MTMLLSEFLAELANPPLPWVVTPEGKIRSNARFIHYAFELTPLVWVTLKTKGRALAMNDIRGFTQALNMLVALVSRLWTATETPLGKDSLRPLLLKACKLEGV